MPNTPATVLEINLDALTHNYTYLKSRLKPNTKFLGVVKAFAYGSETVTVAKKLETLGVDYFAVAYTQEGVVLREAGIATPILVLHPQPSNFDTLIEHRLEPSLYAPRILKLFITAVIKAKKENYPVHIKFNTGLNRLGFWENDVAYIIKKLQEQPLLKVVSVFSHLAASDDVAEVEFTEIQIANFEKIVKTISTKLGFVPLRHLLNTSGILNYSEAQYDMVRSGIGLYGYANDTAIDAALKPVATLKTVISQIHQIEPGESVGYNRGYRSDGYKITATLPLGHADGISRHYGNGKASVLVQGKKAPIIGNVCMDMMMIDVTGIACKEGDEVIVFGENLTAEDFAKNANTISYELLTAISQRVKRITTGS